VQCFVVVIYEPSHQPLFEVFGDVDGPAMIGSGHAPHQDSRILANDQPGVAKRDVFVVRPVNQQDWNSRMRNGILWRDLL
jgi:hypothetical protein